MQPNDHTAQAPINTTPGDENSPTNTPTKPTTASPKCPGDQKHRHAMEKARINGRGMRQPEF